MGFHGQNMISPMFQIIRWYTTWPRTTLPHTVSPLSAISSFIQFSARLITCTFPRLHRRLLSHLDGLDSWDTAMTQMSRFKMQTQGITKFPKTFPQLPGRVVENPTFIQTAHDWTMSLTWGAIIGTTAIIPLISTQSSSLSSFLHRCARHFESKKDSFV